MKKMNLQKHEHLGQIPPKSPVLIPYGRVLKKNRAPPKSVSIGLWIPPYRKKEVS